MMVAAKKWEHDELAADLAAQKLNPKRMVWEDMQLGPSGSPRPDVFTIEKSYSKPMNTVYEIKVSRSDFLADVTAGKYLKYFQYASLVYFAAPDGLISKTEVPEGCGLIVRKPEVWRVQKRAIAQKVSLPTEAALKLLIDGVDRAKKVCAPSPRKRSAWDLARDDRLKLGKVVSRILTDTDHAERHLALLSREADTKRSELTALEQQKSKMIDRYVAEASEKLAADRAAFEAELAALCRMFGCKPNLAALRWDVQRRAREIDRDREVQRLRQCISTVRTAFDQEERGALHALSENG